MNVYINTVCYGQGIVKNWLGMETYLVFQFLVYYFIPSLNIASQTIMV